MKLKEKYRSSKSHLDNDSFTRYVITQVCFAFVIALIFFVAMFSAISCSTSRKLSTLRKESIGAQINIADEMGTIPTISTDTHPKRDTLVVHGDNGEEMLIMKAVKDENGEMVASDIIDAAVVTARFRNVAERHGKVDLAFDIIVPKSMQDSKWQLRFHPTLYAMGDSAKLESVVITGADYRKAQLRGYQRYQRFIDSIITDTTRFAFQRLLEIFIQRNIPDLYAFKMDSTFVDDARFESVFGVTEQDAVEHYTRTWLINRNNRKIEQMDLMFAKYVKAPIVTEGLRLDTVLTSTDGDFVYKYVQTVNTSPGMRKADIVLSGEIFEQDRQIYTIPPTSPLTYYISSLSAFVDDSEHYMTQVIERRAKANTACYIEFALGRHDIDESLGHNAEEISRIKRNLASLAENKVFDLDSIVVTASSSPEGSLALNTALTLRRSHSVSDYFSRYLEHYRDSVKAELGYIIDLNSYRSEDFTPISFIPRNNPENWSMLDALVENDTTMRQHEKDMYRDICSRFSDLDVRESMLSAQPYYRYMREELYPRLRTVRFDFHLHRKDMVKDTVHTTVIDSTYMRGVKALQNADYEAAVTILRPYHDYNAAVAFCAMDYNSSALDILESLDKTDRVNYMLAVIYSRLGDDQKAVDHYLKSCRQNPSFVHRGNLDPEISVLIKRYGLNQQENDEDLGY